MIGLYECKKSNLKDVIIIYEIACLAGSRNKSKDVSPRST